MGENSENALKELLARVEAATGPDRELDARIEFATAQWPSDCLAEFNAGKHGYRVIRGKSVAVDSAKDDYTSSIEAAIGLVERALPGWWWKIGTCCVSDDACIAPDFNSREHSDRLRNQFMAINPGSEFDAGFDVDRRPPGNVPLALLEALLRALIAIAALHPEREA